MNEENLLDEIDKLLDKIEYPNERFYVARIREKLTELSNRLNCKKNYIKKVPRGVSA